MINVNFDSNLLKIDKESYKNVDIYYIGYVTMKYSDNIDIHNATHLYFVIVEVDGCIEESNGNKYLVFASTD